MPRLVQLVSLSILLFVFFFIVPGSTLAECTGEFFKKSCNTDPVCQGPPSIYAGTVTWYGCPLDSDTDANGNYICTRQEAESSGRVCSYPQWYTNSSCTIPTNQNQCATWCSKNGSGVCVAPNEGCFCGTGAVCVDQQYSVDQLCTGQFQQSTHGGCLVQECGWACSNHSARSCSKIYADQGKSARGDLVAGDEQTCKKTLCRGFLVAQCGEGCGTGADGFATCAFPLSCNSNYVCVDSNCPTAANCQCGTPPPTQPPPTQPPTSIPPTVTPTPTTCVSPNSLYTCSVDGVTVSASTCCPSGQTGVCSPNNTTIQCSGGGAPDPTPIIFRNPVVYNCASTGGMCIYNPSPAVYDKCIYGCTAGGSEDCSNYCCWGCPAPLTPWIQTVGGDVHSNTSINTPGGPP